MNAEGSHQAVIVGAGPTGLMLAGELALAGVDAVIVERRPDQTVRASRTGGLHSRTLEVLDQRGIVERFLDAGTVLQIAGFAGIRLDMSDFPTRHPYGLTLWQGEVERLLARWVLDELGVPILRGREVAGFEREASGVVVRLADGTTLAAEYLVGCDGGRSLVRKAAGIGFPGWDPTVSSLIAEVEVTGQPEWGLRYTEGGTAAIGPVDLGDGKQHAAVVVTEPFAGQAEPTLDDVRSALASVWGTDFGAHSPTWISRFTDATRQADTYRAGRVLLAGDAAHIHYPVGGQGMNTGIQDAVNLGWKLAQVLRGTSPESLLDTYEAERHPVAARVLRTTMAQTALTHRDPRTDALRDTVGELLGMDEPRRRLACQLSGLDLRYDMPRPSDAVPPHALVGRRMPDLDVDTADGQRRVYSYLHGARPALLDFGGAGPIDAAAWADRVPFVAATYDGAWLLPVVGPVPAPGAVLVRPDGYVTWVGAAGTGAAETGAAGTGAAGTSAGLHEALETWFGPAAPTPHRNTP